MQRLLPSNIQEKEEEGKEDRSRKEQVNSSDKEIRPLLLRRIIKKLQPR